MQDLLQKHSHAETEISALTDRAKTLINQAQKFIDGKHPDSASIKKRQSEVEDAYTELQQLAQTRLDKLKVSMLQGLINHTLGWLDYGLLVVTENLQSEVVLISELDNNILILLVPCFWEPHHDAYE